MKMQKAGLMLALCFLVLGAPFKTEAATKPIQTVSVKVNSKLEPGGTLPPIEISAQTPKAGEINVSGGSDKYQVTEAVWADKVNIVLKASDEPRMKVTIEPVDVGED